MGRRGPRSSAELLALAPVRQARAEKRAATAHDEPPPAPSHLSAEMRAFWSATLTEHMIDPHRLGTLQCVCESWDRMQQARRELGKSGLSYTDEKGMIRSRPEVAVERDSRVGYLRALRELRLDIEPAKGPRARTGWVLSPMKKPKKFPPEALVIFRCMQALDEQACMCADMGAQCEACVSWWEQHERLHQLLRAKPWQWPCVENSDWQAQGYTPDPDAQRLYRELDRAALTSRALNEPKRRQAGLR